MHDVIRKICIYYNNCDKGTELAISFINNLNKIRPMQESPARLRNAG